MIKTGTVVQDSITKVEIDGNSEIITETVIKAKKRKDFLDEEELSYDVCTIDQ